MVSTASKKVVAPFEAIQYKLCGRRSPVGRRQAYSRVRSIDL